MKIAKYHDKELDKGFKEWQFISSAQRNPQNPSRFKN